jgi:imidazolonepropionase-like amidohydrolase
VEELQAAAQAAHDAGRDVAIHAYSTEGILRAVKAGIDHIETWYNDDEE